MRENLFHLFMQMMGITRISVSFASSLLLGWTRWLICLEYPETTGVQVKLHGTLNNLLLSFVLRERWVIFSTETCLKFQGNPQPRGDEKKYQSSIISFPSNTRKVNIAGHMSLRTDFQTPNVRDPAILNASLLLVFAGFRWVQNLVSLPHQNAYGLGLL